MKLKQYITECKSSIETMRTVDKFNKHMNELEMKMVKTMERIIDKAPLEELDEIETYIADDLSLDKHYISKLLDRIAKKQIGNK